MKKIKKLIDKFIFDIYLANGIGEYSFVAFVFIGLGTIIYWIIKLISFLIGY